MRPNVRSEGSDGIRINERDDVGFVGTTGLDDIEEHEAVVRRIVSRTFVARAGDEPPILPTSVDLDG